MKPVYQILAAFLTLTTFTFSECNKKDVVLPLPAETQTGANTFGCKINGIIYTPRGSGNCYKFLIQYYKSDSLLAINTNNGCISGLSIFLKGVYETKDYTIFAPAFNSFYYNTNETNCNRFDRTNSLQTGTITITRFDLTAKIVSGRFNGVLKQIGCPDVKITEGRFDFVMDVYN